MINFSFIEKIFSLIGFNSILWDRVRTAFIDSFKRTNEEFHWESEPSKAALDYFEQRELILSEKTLARLHGNLKYEILEGIQGRESITEIIKRINPIFDNMKRFELERIARTETINAFNAGEFQSHLQSGVAKWKSWHANINNLRTAEDSKRLHGQVRKIEDSFIDPKNNKECMHSPNRPNCRCTIHYHYEKPKTIKKHGMDYLE